MDGRSKDEVAAPEAASVYDASYYASHCGPIPYDPAQPVWAEMFGRMADELIRTFRPRRVFDAGCALGFLVGAFWDRGVEASGRDVSDFAISKVRADIRQFCVVGDLAEPIEGRFDLVTCIEVLEHMTEADGARALDNMVAVTDRIVFSSSPNDLAEPTHINVKPPIYWMRAFAERGFVPVIEATLPSITPHALAFERRAERPSEDYLVACAELVRDRMRMAEDRQTIEALRGRAAERDAIAAARDQAAAEAARLAAEHDRLTAERDRLSAERDGTLAERARVQEQLDQALAERGQVQQNFEAVQAERDWTLAELDHAVAGRARAQEQLDQALAERDQVQRNHESVLAEQDRTRAERDQALAERDQALAERDQVQRDHEGVLAEQDRTRAERDRALAERGQVQQRLKVVQAERDRALAERDRAKRDREGMLAERDGARGERDRALADRDHALAARTRAREQRDRMREKGRGAVARARDETARLRGLLDDAVREQERLHAAHRAILHSTTWRLTRALRSGADRVPAPVRTRLRQALKLAYWSATLQLGERLRARRNPPRLALPADQVAGFDADYYLRENHDVAAAGADPTWHYVAHGRAEGRNPNAAVARGAADGGVGPDEADVFEDLDEADRFDPPAAPAAVTGFDAAYYLSENPDVASAALDPLAHYQSHGKAEGRHPTLAAAREARAAAIGLDAAYYLRENPDVAGSGADPLEHFLSHGQAEGRHPSALAAYKAIPIHLKDLCDPDRDEPGARVFDEAFQVSVITPTYNTDPRYLRELYQTLVNQQYGNWEWVVVDDGSSNPATVAMLRRLAGLDPRVRVTVNPVNRGISGASNDALAAARGTHAALVDHDDLISRDAFLAIYEAWKAAPGTQLFFTDECKLLADGTLGQFWAKPAWSPSYLENTMCLGHLSVYRLDFLRELGGFRSEYDGTQDYDLALRASLARPEVVHLPIFAYLWRIIPGSAAADLNEKHYAVERQGRAVLDYARHIHPEAEVKPGFAAGYWRIVYPLPSPAPLLSYVIPTGGGSRMVRGERVDLVLNCVRSFEEKAFYPNREYVVVHNGDLTAEQTRALQAVPGVRLVHYAAPAFNFSEKLNLGVAAAQGTYLCLLNDDVEAITPRGGEELVGYLDATPGVGAVGPLCLREDGRIQQNGVLLLGAVGPAHAGDNRPGDFGGHQAMLRCRREAFCIGGAILFIRKEHYDLVGGFDEGLPLNYNDVDFGLNLRERGLACVVDPSIAVYHFEGATKVGTSTVEQERMFLKHPDLTDPYFSPWFDQADPNYRLNLVRQDTRLRFGPWLDRHIARRAAALLPRGEPRLSVCVSIYNQPKRLLEEMYNSVVMQTYANKEFVILDNGSSNPETLEWLNGARRRAQATIVRADDNLGISGGNLKLLETMTGDFFVAMDADDFMSVDALQMMAYVIERNSTRHMFYSDEYKSDMSSTRFAPFFKPDFDPVLLMNCCYPAHLMVIRADFLRRIGSYTDAHATWCHDYDTLTRALAIGEEPVHVRELTYAWRINPGSTASAETSGKPEAVESQRFVLTRLLRARGLDRAITVEPNTLETSSGMWRLKALEPVAGVRTFGAGEVWGRDGLGVAGLVAAAREGDVAWVAILLEPGSDAALLDLSAVAWLDERVDAVCGVLLDRDRRVRWSGGLFLPGGRVMDPYAGEAFAAGGYHGEIWCQRCIDVAAPVNVLIRAEALVRAAGRPGVSDADGLMAVLGLDAQEQGRLVAVTPQLQALAPPPSLVLPPLDRAGLLLGAEALEGGSRWYDGRLEADRPYRMPGME